MNYDPINKIALIDQFAMAALPSIVDKAGFHCQKHPRETVKEVEAIAELSYIVADAMIKMRGVQKGMPSRYKRPDERVKQ